LKRSTAILLSIAFAPAGAAIAQPAPDVPPAADRSELVDVGTPAATRTTDAPTQISTGAESSPAEAQLTSARASHQETRQLSTGPRSAQAPEALSRPSDGRTAAIERVEGADRCDPAVPKEKQSDECRKVIESRADEYARRERPELSPEQRLLIDQRWGPGAADVAEATRRLATSGEPGESSESLGIASIVLQQSQPAQEPEKKAEDPADNAAVQAIIQLVTQTPPN
jgi:hypothetical protein